MKTPDELINRVVLLSSTLKSALKEGETTFTVIKNQPLENLEAASEYFKEPIRNPSEHQPYKWVCLTIGDNSYLEIRGTELKPRMVFE